MKKKVEVATLKEMAKGNAIAKVCSVLRSMSVNSPLRLSEVSDYTGLNRVTALRILDDLAEAGFVEKKGSPPRYDFGPEVIAMSAAGSRSLNIRDLVRPCLLRLAEMTGDTLLMSVRSHAEAICVERVTGNYPIRANFLDIGSRRPLGVGGGSMALLAWLPEAEREAILEITNARLEAYPNLSIDMLRDHISAANEKGYVAMYDIVIEKMGAIGYPVRDLHGTVVASISVVALSERIAAREQEIVDALSREAKLITRKMAE